MRALIGRGCLDLLFVLFTSLRNVSRHLAGRRISADFLSIPLSPGAVNHFQEINFQARRRTTVI